MNSETVYSILRELTSPVVAVTTRSQERRNGMIANSAVRASLVPGCPRLSFYCFKFHYSHELIEESGRFCLHLLHRNQVSVVDRLGFESGRDRDKLSGIDHSVTDSGLPRIDDAAAVFDCRVLNAMDAGPSTFFLGEAENVERHPNFEELDLLESDYLRENLPEERREDYRTNKRKVQERAAGHLEVDPTYRWNAPGS